MKVVIISQNCYPYIGPRANRATELAKEFARQGHNVNLYALLGDCNYDVFSSETKVSVRNLGVSKYGLEDNAQHKKRNVFFKAFERLLGRYFDFPKCELKNMTYRALKTEKTADILVTIAHPHTIHWGAAKYVKRYSNTIKTWIADCGDPYMMNPHFHYPWYFKYAEKKWCQLCSFITVPIEEARNAYYPEFSDKIRVIPQGFDFESNRLAEYKPNRVPTFAFSGIFYEKLRDPHAFLDYLCTIERDFKFVIYIKDTPYYRSAFHLDEYQQKLGNCLEIHDFVPRSVLLYELSKMDFLINIRNVSGVQQPSKLIDYALTRRPILEITSDFNERPAFDQFLEGNYDNQIIVENLERYDVRNIVKQMISLSEKDEKNS